MEKTDFRYQEILDEFKSYLDSTPVEKVIEDIKKLKKPLYCIIRVNKMHCGTSIESPCNTLEEAKKMLDYIPNYDIIVEGKMHWVNARVKGVKLASGEVILYGEYEREYFVQHQLEKLKTLAL